MDNWLWKWVWRIAILVGAAVGIITIAERLTKPENVPPIMIYYSMGICFVIAVIGLLLDFKPWRPKEENFLLGQWFIRSALDNTFMAVWEFFAGSTPREGTVIERKAKCTGVRKELEITHGTWRFEDASACVHIIWETLQPSGRGPMWDNFTRPIKPSVRGDNWMQVHNCVVADKIGTLKTS